MEERPPVSLDDSLTKMIANRPEIKAAEAQEKAAESAYQLAWMQLLPDFQLVAGTTFYRVPSASPLSNLPDAATSGYPTHTYMAGVQLTLPLWFLFNEREVISGASKDRVVASANLDIQHEQSRVSLVTVVEAINGFRLKIKNYEEHMLPMAEQALNIALTSYGAGKIPFQTLSDTASARRQIRLAYAQAIVSYETNYATYGQLIGEDL
jgi:outer membrane protein TolC